MIHLSANGGYLQLPESMKACGFLASQVAMSSGVGNYYHDKLYALLYEHSIDFDIQILPFNRHIEGAAREEDVSVLMSLMQQIFTKSHFTKYSYERVVKKAREQAAHLNKEIRQGFEEAYIEFNNPDSRYTKFLCHEDFERADFSSMKRFFKNNFSDPAEFSCVIAGSFNMDKMIDMVLNSFALIPERKNHRDAYKFPDRATLSKGIKTKIIDPKLNQNESLTALTFPVSIDVTSQNISSLENIASLMRTRLKSVLRTAHGIDIAINLSLEYPYYPSMRSPSFKILYISSPKDVSAIGQTILLELKKMQEASVTSKEIATMARKHQKKLRPRGVDSCYWIVLLSNYLMWEWDLLTLPDNLKPLTEPTKVENALKTYFSVDKYTMISS